MSTRWARSAATTSWPPLRRLVVITPPRARCPLGHLRRCRARTEEVCCTGMLRGRTPYNRQLLSASWNRDQAGRARRASEKLLGSRRRIAGPKEQIRSRTNGRSAKRDFCAAWTSEGGRAVGSSCSAGRRRVAPAAALVGAAACLAACGRRDYCRRGVVFPAAADTAEGGRPRPSRRSGARRGVPGG